MNERLIAIILFVVPNTDVRAIERYYMNEGLIAIISFVVPNTQRASNAVCVYGWLVDGGWTEVVVPSHTGQ